MACEQQLATLPLQWHEQHLQLRYTGVDCEPMEYYILAYPDVTVNSVEDPLIEDWLRDTLHLQVQ